jgi:excisionase family DNA binding protein
MPPVRELLTTAEVADQFDVHPHTVRRWIKEGRLTPSVTLPSGRVRFTREDVEAILGGDQPESAA